MSAVPDSSYLQVLRQFLSSQNYPFMQISHLHKGIPMAVNGRSLAFPVRAEIFMSSLKNKFSMNIEMRTALKLNCYHLINIHENC